MGCLALVAALMHGCKLHTDLSGSDFIAGILPINSVGARDVIRRIICNAYFF
jgi:hypothetical protein